MARPGRTPMAARSFPNLLQFMAALLVAGGICCPAVVAQGPLPGSPRPAAEDAPHVVASYPAAVVPVVAATPRVVAEHRFWDTPNRLLFAASAAMSAADFAVTRSNLQNGGAELNPMVRVFGRSTAGLAANFAGETAGVVGFTYLLHKTGHHKLERMLSVVNLGASAAAVGYGSTHR